MVGATFVHLLVGRIPIGVSLKHMAWKGVR